MKPIAVFVMMIETLFSIPFEIQETIDLGSGWRSAEVSSNVREDEVAVLLVASGGEIFFAKDFRRSMPTLKEIFGRLRTGENKREGGVALRELISILIPKTVASLELYPSAAAPAVQKELARRVAPEDRDFQERVGMVFRIMETKKTLETNSSKRFFAFLEGDRIILYTILVILR